MVRPGQNLISSKILWVSWLSVSLNMIRSKVKVLSSGQLFLHYKSMGIFFVAQRKVTLKRIVLSGLKFNSSKILWLSSLSASLMKIESRMKSLSSGQHFPYYTSMGAFGCCGNQGFDPICPKTVCCLSPTKMMQRIKFDRDWQTGVRDIQVWKCGDGQQLTDGGLMDGGLTDCGPMVCVQIWVAFWKVR